MAKIGISGDVTTFYTYRSALLSGHSVRIELDDQDLRYLDHKLKKYGYELDNHICFSIGNIDFQISDSKLYIGKGFIVQPW